MTRLTDEQFDEFEPERDAEGCFRRRCWNNPDDAAAIELATIENRIWTELDCDECRWPVIASGSHYVNRLDYIITARPWDRDYEVVDEDEY